MQVHMSPITYSLESAAGIAAVLEESGCGFANVTFQEGSWIGNGLGLCCIFALTGVFRGTTNFFAEHEKRVSRKVVR